VCLVAADLLEAAAVLAAQSYQDAAVALAEDARRGLPLDPAVGCCMGAHRFLLDV
jgi:hypothetical protein